MRERAVLNQDLTRSNKFWTEVIHLFQFCWPYEVNNTFHLDHESGLYGFSGLYERQLREIRMWRMDHSFFVSFPDTYDDIVHLDGIPLRLMQPGGEAPATTEEGFDLDMHAAETK